MIERHPEPCPELVSGLFQNLNFVFFFQLPPPVLNSFQEKKRIYFVVYSESLRKLRAANAPGLPQLLISSSASSFVPEVLDTCGSPASQIFALSIIDNPILSC
jgi:hypothetical protein